MHATLTLNDGAVISPGMQNEIHSQPNYVNWRSFPCFYHLSHILFSITLTFFICVSALLKYSLMIPLTLSGINNKLNKQNKPNQNKALSSGSAPKAFSAHPPATFFGKTGQKVQRLATMGVHNRTDCPGYKKTKQNQTKKSTPKTRTTGPGICFFP